MIVNLSLEMRVLGNDGICFELQRVAKKGSKSKDAGASSWKSIGYYSSLEQACNAAIAKGLCSDVDEASAKEIVAAIRSAAEMISRACASAKPLAKTSAALPKIEEKIKHDAA
jgi:hypothetical protein